MNEVMNSVGDYWSKFLMILSSISIYFTAEVCSNITDLLAFILVTPEFLPPERRLHIAQKVERVGTVLNRFTDSFAFRLAYYTTAFPFVVLVMTVLLQFFKSIAKYIMGLMPQFLATIMELWIIVTAICLLIISFLGIFRPGQMLNEKDKENSRYSNIIITCAILLTFAMSLQARLNIELMTEPIKAIVWRGVEISLYCFISSGVLVMIAYLFKSFNKDTSFWIGAGLFVIARAIMIWDSASGVWIGVIDH